VAIYAQLSAPGDTPTGDNADTSTPEGNSGTTPVWFIVTRTGDLSGPVTVTLERFGSASITDATGVPASVSFAAGQSAVSFQALISGDTLVEADDTLGLRITGTDRSDVTVSATNGDVTHTIANDDAANRAPVAQDDTVETDEGQVLTGNVLVDNGNGVDADPDGNSISVTLGTGPSGGTLNLASNGSFTYTPTGDFSGTDSFTYVLSDGRLSDTATVTITVNETNEAPTATDDTVTTGENETASFNVLTVGTADSDPDGDTLTVSAVQGDAANVGVPVTLASGATVTVLPGGLVSYDPGTVFDSLAGGDIDTDSFSYAISDGKGGTDTATVTITLTGANDGPAAQDDTVTAQEGFVLTGDLFADNGNGADSDPDFRRSGRDRNP
jgi:hypothetical protein